MKPPQNNRSGGGRPPGSHGPRGGPGGSPGGGGPGGGGPQGGPGGSPGRGPGRGPGSGSGSGHGSGRGSGQPPRGPGGPPWRDRPDRDRSSEGDRSGGPRHGFRGGGQGHRSAPSQPRPPEPPRGSLWIYGQHAVAAALGNTARRLRRLLLTEEAEAALAERLRPPWPLPPERVDRGRLDQLLGRDVVHQGAALLSDLLPTPSLQSALERPGPVIVLDQVTDPRNVGAILRSAAAFGVAVVITQDRNAPEETGALAKAASGALETVPLLRAVNIARTLVALKAANLWVIGLDAAGAAPLSGASLAGRRIALVVGAEGTGLRRLTRETCDEVAKLQMPGAMESLNVAAAAAIALYEVTRPL